MSTMTTKPNTEKPLLLLIDGSNLAFRMFFALEMSNLRDSKGNPTWAVYGTLKAFFDMLEFAKPTAAAVAFDLPVPTYRHEIFEEYKANRPDDMPDDMKPQWNVIKESFRKFHIPVLEEPGFEADDLIGIMAKDADKAGYEVIILSGDKDLYQLVNENIKIAVPQRKGGLELFGESEVFEKMGVTPVQVADYKGIAGDSSDNIPGVRGLGPKAATKLLGDYGSLEGIYENIDKVGPPKTKDKLVDQEEQARLSKHLATIITDGSGVKDCDLSLEHCQLDLPELETLVSFLEDLEFRSILGRLSKILKPFNDGKPAAIPMSEETAYETDTKWEKLETPLEDISIQPKIINTENDFQELISKLNKVDHYAVDLETTGLNTFTCEIVGWAFALDLNHSERSAKSLADKDIESFYIPLMHQGATQLDSDYVLEGLKLILEDKNKCQIIQNAKYEQKIFQRLGVKNHNNFYDTLLASYVDNPANKHGLKAQSRRVFHQRMVEIEDIIGSGKKQITIDQAPLEQVAPYAATDAHVTLKLYHHYNKIFESREKELLKNFEFPLVEVLRDIEIEGVDLDTKYLAELSVEVHQKIDTLKAKIFNICDEEFNISSPKQLNTILYEKMGMPTIGKKTKSGGYSTSVDTLEAILKDYDIDQNQKDLLEGVLEYRTLTKLASTYIDNLPTLVNKETLRLHSEFNQVGTATGRLSSNNPNLQNIPIRSAYGKKVRQAFIAKDGYKLLSADYSQIELRVLAHMAEADALIDAFNNNQDIHKRTAMEIFEIKSEVEVTSEQRSIGKTLNFALIYMQGAFATAKQLNISNSEAKQFIDKYFEAFPSIKPFMESVLGKAHGDNFTETLFGRRRYFQNINSPNKMLMKEEERQAFNAPLQGTASDIMKLAMINSHKALKDLKSKIILQVHDELVIEVAEGEEDKVKEIINKEMSQAAQLKVPLLVDMGLATNWLDCG